MNKFLEELKRAAIFVVNLSLAWAFVLGPYWIANQINEHYGIECYLLQQAPCDQRYIISYAITLLLQISVVLLAAWLLSVYEERKRELNGFA